MRTPCWTSRSLVAAAAGRVGWMRGARVSTSLTGVGAITLFVEDLDHSRSFYADVFGRPVVHEDEDSAVFDFGNMLVNLLAAPAARELVEPAAVPGPGAGP